MAPLRCSHSSCWAWAAKQPASARASRAPKQPLALQRALPTRAPWLPLDALLAIAASVLVQPAFGPAWKSGLAERENCRCIPETRVFAAPCVLFASAPGSLEGGRGPHGRRETPMAPQRRRVAVPPCSCSRSWRRRTLAAAGGAHVVVPLLPCAPRAIALANKSFPLSGARNLLNNFASLRFRAFGRDYRAFWSYWGLSPGPSACEADVIPLHHVPLSDGQGSFC